MDYQKKKNKECGNKLLQTQYCSNVSDDFNDLLLDAFGIPSKNNLVYLIFVLTK